MSTGARMTIVYNKVSDAIDFYMDNAGIDLLIGTLQSLKVDGNHLHLWAGNDRGLSISRHMASKPCVANSSRIFSRLTLGSVYRREALTPAALGGLCYCQRQVSIVIAWIQAQ
jgi:hypothetical protein